MLKDLLQKLIIVLGLEYLLFFSLEVILPGLVTSAFNINILLLVVLLLVTWLSLLNSQEKGKDKNKIKNENKSKVNKDGTEDIHSMTNTKWFLFLGIGLLFVNAIALYKVSIFMIVVYLVIVIIITKLLWRNL